MFRNKEYNMVISSAFKDFEPPMEIKRETTQAAEAIISPTRIVSGFLGFMLVMWSFQALETNGGLSSQTFVLLAAGLVCFIVFVCGRGLDWTL